jgi:hypothetical protein
MFERLLRQKLYISIQLTLLSVYKIRKPEFSCVYMQKTFRQHLSTATKFSNTNINATTKFARMILYATKHVLELQETNNYLGIFNRRCSNAAEFQACNKNTTYFECAKFSVFQNYSHYVSNK